MKNVLVKYLLFSLFFFLFFSPLFSFLYYFYRRNILLVAGVVLYPLIPNNFCCMQYYAPYITKIDQFPVKKLAQLDIEIK